MFDITIHLTTKIADCPPEGLAAIDFRRNHGLPERASAVEEIQVEISDELACRAAQHRLSSGADLGLRQVTYPVNGGEIPSGVLLEAEHVAALVRLQKLPQEQRNADDAARAAIAVLAALASQSPRAGGVRSTLAS